MCPYRTTSAFTFAEGPSDAPPQWWIPELSCFKGHEHRLPIDSHGLLALIAPRHMMAATAWTDGCEPTWAVERSYKAGREVYRMLGAPENLRIKYRPGQHHGFLDVDSYFGESNTLLLSGQCSPERSTTQRRDRGHMQIGLTSLGRCRASQPRCFPRRWFRTSPGRSGPRRSSTSHRLRAPS